MKKISITQFINERVIVRFIDNDIEEGWFVRDKYHTNRWSILSINKNKSISFVKSYIKSITWLSNNKVIKYNEIDFEE